MPKQLLHLLPHLHLRDRVHPVVQSHGQADGEASAELPSLQQPRRDERCRQEAEAAGRAGSAGADVRSSLVIRRVESWTSPARVPLAESPWTRWTPPPTNEIVTSIGWPMGPASWYDGSRPTSTSARDGARSTAWHAEARQAESTSAAGGGSQAGTNRMRQKMMGCCCMRQG